MSSTSPVSHSQQPRVVFFIDGMNLWHRCLAAFGHGNVHIHLLAQRFLCGRRLQRVRYYCGVDSPRERPRRHAERSRRIASLRANGISVWTQTMKYAEREIVLDSAPLCPCGRKESRVIKEAREKGIDLRIGLDMMRMARHDEYDVAVLVSMDSDMKQVVDELRALSSELSRPLWVENIVVWNGPEGKYPRVRGCAAYHVIDQAVFDAIVDTTDYSIPYRPGQGARVS